MTVIRLPFLEYGSAVHKCGWLLNNEYQIDLHTTDSHLSTLNGTDQHMSDTRNNRICKIHVIEYYKNRYMHKESLLTHAYMW